MSEELRKHVEDALDIADAREGELRALVVESGRRERVLGELAALIERSPDPASRPPLFGVLLGVKDIFGVQGLPMRAGSALPPEAFPTEEAVCVARLRAAGALVLGKTVTAEFAFSAPGATTHPRDPRRTPGGSSSGSAAAVAAGYAALALGSQTVGSVIRPAAFCGVVGFKPSYGRLPRDGMLPFSESVDCVGLLAKDLETAERGAAATLEDWAGAGALERPRLGVPDGPYLALPDAATRAAFEGQIAALEARGVEVQRVPAFEDFEALARRHRTLIAGEFAREHAARFARWGSLYRGPSAELFDRGRALPDAEIERGRRSCAALRADLESRMDAASIDLWACPAATGVAPRGLGTTGDPAMNLPWTHAHLPVLTLPAGSGGDGLPLGLQLAARLGHDERLFAWARALEPS